MKKSNSGLLKSNRSKIIAILIFSPIALLILFYFAQPILLKFRVSKSINDLSLASDYSIKDSISTSTPGSISFGPTYSTVVYAENDGDMEATRDELLDKVNNSYDYKADTTDSTNDVRLTMNFERLGLAGFKKSCSPAQVPLRGDTHLSLLLSDKPLEYVSIDDLNLVTDINQFSLKKCNKTNKTTYIVAVIWAM